MIQRVASSSSSRLEKQRKEIQHRVVNYREDPRLGPGTGPVLTFDYIVNSSPQTQSRVYSETCGSRGGTRKKGLGIVKLSKQKQERKHSYILKDTTLMLEPR